MPRQDQLPMYFDLGSILIYVFISAAFITGTLLVGFLLRPKKPYAQKLTTYECGEDTIGTSFIQFNIRFYIIALIFLIFDVEVAILFPWAVIFKEYGIIALAEMLFFVAILVAGFVYVWVKKDLEWITSAEEAKQVKAPISK